jgi:hypothetical protein
LNQKEQEQKDDLDDSTWRKYKSDDGEDDYYYDVLIGGNQNLIRNLINDLHKISHDNIFKGSIAVDKLGIKQIDYDIYAPPTIEFNQDQVGNVVIVIEESDTVNTISRIW